MSDNYQRLFDEDWEFELEQNLLDKRRELIIMMDAEHTEVEIQSPPPSELPTPMWAKDLETAGSSLDPVARWLELAQEWEYAYSCCTNPVQEFFKHFYCDYTFKDYRTEF